MMTSLSFLSSGSHQQEDDDIPLMTVSSSPPSTIEDHNTVVEPVMVQEEFPIYEGEAMPSMEEEPFPGVEEPIPVTDRAYDDDNLYQVESADDDEEVYSETVDQRQASSPLRESTANSHGASFTLATSSSIRSTPTPASSSSLRFFRNHRLGTDEDGSPHESTRRRQNTPTKSPTREELFTPHFRELHDKNILRRQNMQQSKHDLERRIAAITSQLANMTMSRDAYNCTFLKDRVCTPMEQAGERISMEKDCASSPHHVGSKHWMSLTARLSHLEADMSHQTHVQAPQLIRQQLDQSYNTLTQQVSPAVNADQTKSEKREGSMLRQFEDIAGTARRRHHEERASRHGSFAMVKHRLLAEAQVESDPHRIEEAIVKVRALRAKLDQERVTQRMRDEHLRAAIEEEII
jgi:hypothetical protein